MKRRLAGLLLIFLGAPVLPALRYPTLVDRFYRERRQQLYWFAPGEAAVSGRRQLLACIDSAAWMGLDSTKYHPEILRREDNDTGGLKLLMGFDRQYTDAALALAFDIFCGDRATGMLSYDGVSPLYAGRDEELLLGRMLHIMPDGLTDMLRRLEPSDGGYALLKDSLRIYLDASGGSASRAARLSTAMNAWRWIHHFGFDRFIVVNLPSATLSYYSGDSLSLRMKVVAGQTSKRTPRFAAWVDGLVLYPYWNIPHKIAVRELLPLFRRAPGLATLMDIQVLDDRGKQIDPVKVNWSAYTAASFPYTLRQAPGCENALGVLKFDINSPFDVYMHDTNLKRAFGSSWRYMSHGCIRLEKPLLLGELLLDNRLDTAMLNACLRDQQPVPVSLRPRVPVFVVYETVEAQDGRLSWLRDVYHLLP